ncbi:hypothetical protein J0895_07040 [Phormidium pseudopriestleyi FRX01]|uniref:Uncharacterized protein n=1 Tax=Phormidium pseudopriestleyi FRX01 TaxID=1759528 RepID=A0ABS3FP10_9CYAN|nr:hypothetical protein [Phormidium pseudopriestleyi]MBO0348858.1 hypothetical protein [Phormidium pseudopriestleyi FRX01]
MGWTVFTQKVDDPDKFAIAQIPQLLEHFITPLTPTIWPILRESTVSVETAIAPISAKK